MPPKQGNGTLAVPTITEDATERKRVLNVLAQRRYRRRKKDKLQTLQAQIEKQHERGATVTTSSRVPLQPELQTSSNGIAKSKHLGALDSSNSLLDLDFDSNIQDDLNLSTSSRLDIAPDNVPLSPPSFLSLLSTTDAPQPFSIPQVHTSYDSFIANLALPPLQSSPEPESTLDLSNDDLFNWPATTHPKITYNLSDELQTSECSTFTFPDDHIIEIPSLKLLNAALQVALRLNVADILWDITAISPFYKPPRERPQSQTNIQSTPGREITFPPSLTTSSSSSAPSSSSPHPPQPHEASTPIASLPLHLHPTQTQLSLPHHPLLDILPWPSTRDKLIQIFNLPPSLRPKSAQDRLGILRLVYDMEDESGEGVKIHGEDVFDERNWEIGQVVFERWWWAFEGSLVERVARGRRRRGEVGLEIRKVD
ncbi:hypothetical protein BJX70DRAFT_395989 [Aspergillus crustosus]